MLLQIQIFLILLAASASTALRSPRDAATIEEGALAAAIEDSLTGPSVPRPSAASTAFVASTADAHAIAADEAALYAEELLDELDDADTAVDELAREFLGGPPGDPLSALFRVDAAASQVPAVDVGFHSPPADPVATPEPLAAPAPVAEAAAAATATDAGSAAGAIATAAAAAESNAANIAGPDEPFSAQEVADFMNGQIPLEDFATLGRLRAVARAAVRELAQLREGLGLAPAPAGLGASDDDGGAGGCVCPVAQCHS